MSAPLLRDDEERQDPKVLLEEKLCAYLRDWLQRMTTRRERVGYDGASVRFTITEHGYDDDDTPWLQVGIEEELHTSDVSGRVPLKAPGYDPEPVETEQ